MARFNNAWDKRDHYNGMYLTDLFKEREYQKTHGSKKGVVDVTFHIAKRAKNNLLEMSGKTKKYKKII